MKIILCFSKHSVMAPSFAFNSRYLRRMPPKKSQRLVSTWLFPPLRILVIILLRTGEWESVSLQWVDGPQWCSFNGWGVVSSSNKTPRNHEAVKFRHALATTPKGCEKFMCIFFCVGKDTFIETRDQNTPICFSSFNNIDTVLTCSVLTWHQPKGWVQLSYAWAFLHQVGENCSLPDTPQ